MPINEIVNALFLTYIGTEYLLVSSYSGKHNNSNNNNNNGIWSILQSHKLITLVVIGINVIIKIQTIVTTEALWHVRVGLAAVGYIVGLYFDCRKSNRKLTIRQFLKHVSIAFCRVFPVYPFLAVLISFVFMFVISIFETLHLPLELLNWPIYYGTLYGPFSWIYYTVKRRVVEATQSLPTTTTATTIGGGIDNNIMSINDRRMAYYAGR